METEQTESEKEANDPSGIAVDLKEKLITEGKLKDDKILLFHQEDFDGDGTEEAFSLVMRDNAKEFDDGQIVEGDVWFVSQKECKKILESAGMGLDVTDSKLVLGNTKYELFDDVYATGRLTYAWYVAGGELKAAPFSRIGTVIIDYDQFRILDSNYDKFYDPEVGGMLGHTWKQYYFFF